MMMIIQYNSSNIISNDDDSDDAVLLHQPSIQPIHHDLKKSYTINIALITILQVD